MEEILVDVVGELGIELPHRVVGETGEVDHSVDAVEVFQLDVANVAQDLPVGGDVALARRDAILEIADVESGHPMAALLGEARQDRADVALIAGDQNVHGMRLPVPARGKEGRLFQPGRPRRVSAAPQFLEMVSVA